MAGERMRSITRCMLEVTDILKDIAGTQNLERTLHNIVKNLQESLECQTCAIIRLNPKTERLEILNSSGISWQFTKAFRIRDVPAKLHELIWADKQILLSNVMESPDLTKVLKLEKPFASVCFTPFSASQRPLGYLFVTSEKPDAFDGDDQLICHMYAKIIAMGLLKANLINEIQEQGIKNKKTGAVSYAHFYARLQESLSQVQRHSEPLTLLLLDVVKFDYILSQHGGKVCQELMTELMISVNDILRNYDCMSKFGTDEIIISLPGHSMDEGYSCTKKILEHISKSQFTSEKLNIDLSIGIANFPGNAESVTGLLTAVKNALMDSKRAANSKIFKSSSFFD